MGDHAGIAGDVRFAFFPAARSGLPGLPILRSCECAIGLVVKYFVANEVPRVRFPDGAFFFGGLLDFGETK